jgi:regulatory protein
LNLLARREHSRAELRQKLQAKGFDAQVVDDVVTVLAQQSWQNDARFADAFIRQRIRDGYGPVRIGHELRQRGIDNADMDAAVKETAESWDELLEQVYLKKYPTDTRMTRNEWAKRVRFLQQRGFSYDLIRSLANRLNIKTGSC